MISTYHGGGSAALASYYAVTPLDGIKNKLDTPPEYTVGQSFYSSMCLIERDRELTQEQSPGQYSHLMIPLLGYSTQSKSGNQGMTMRFYNEGPEVSDRCAFHEVELQKTDMFLVDYHHPELKTELFYATLEGSLVADEDCTYELGLVVVGSANLYVNDVLIIDNTKEQTLGSAFFGCGTVEEKSFYKVKNGKTCKHRLVLFTRPNIRAIALVYGDSP
jgi:beta-glucosidase